jgi:Rieske Fe-S protein
VRYLKRNFIKCAASTQHYGLSWALTAFDISTAPRHGSRFAPDGTLLEGPATRDLTGLVLTLSRNAQPPISLLRFLGFVR